MMKRILFIALLMSLGRLAAQQSGYQDAAGNSSIYFLAGSANMTFNVSSSKFDVGLLRMPDGQSQNFDWHERGIYGIHFSGKPSTDLTNQIFQSSSSPASIGGGGVLGFHRWWAPLGKEQTTNTVFTDDWFLVNINYSKSTFATVPASSTSSTTQHFNGFSIMPTYNFTLQGNGLMTMIFGASAGVSRVNNADQLKKVSIDTTVSQSGSVSIVQSKDAYLGTYAESYNLPVYSDFVFLPAKCEWLSLDVFERSNAMKTDGYAEGGFGVFVAQPKKPTKVLGGISVGWKDGERTIGIVGGWSF